MKKNHVDQVFKDRLKDYQETPDERVWESIAASLDKKKSKKRVVPIWWRLGGVAAALALLLYLFLPLESGTSPEGVTDTDQPVEMESSNTPQDLQQNDQLQKEEGYVRQSETPSAVPQTETAEMPEPEIKVATSENTGLPTTSNSNGTQLSGEKDKNQSVNQALALQDDEEQDSFKNHEAGEAAAEEARFASNMTTQKERASESEKQKALLEGVAENKDEVETGEEKVEPAVKKSIFDVIEEQEEEAVAEDNSTRWSVGPMVAPVYFNTLSEGSPIHSNVVANSKSGNVNLSYGVAVSYQVSKKMSVRSGVHRVDYGYDTDEVRFSSSLSASTSTLIDNIDYDTNSRTLVVESQAGRGAQQNAALDANEVTALSPAREGRMVQNFGYLEVPVELHYRLLDRKLGINLIGGVSSLFLTGNSVTLVADNTSTSMGEANNLNEVNFSTNLGLGVFYRLSPKMQLNLEPMFKYQLNTFSQSAGNFQPFSLGVYSGLNFRF